MYIPRFCTVYKQAKGKQWTSTNHNCFYRSRASENRLRSITRSNRSRKPAPIFGVENRSRFCMTHVPKVGSDFRLWKSAPVFDLVCLQPYIRPIPPSIALNWPWIPKGKGLKLCWTVGTGTGYEVSSCVVGGSDWSVDKQPGAGERDTEDARNAEKYEKTGQWVDAYFCKFISLLVNIVWNGTETRLRSHFYELGVPNCFPSFVLGVPKCYSVNQSLCPVIL